MKEKVEGLIVDFDNTIVDTEGFIREHLTKVCQRLEVAVPDRERLEAILRENLPFDEIFNRLFGGTEGLKILENYRSDAAETKYKAIEGAVNWVKRQNESGVVIVIVTNRANLIELRLEQAGFGKNDFMAIVTPPFSKPDQQAYEPAINILMGRGIRRESIVFVGDSLDDYQAVPEDLKSENRFWGVETGFHSRQDFEKLGVSGQQIKARISEINFND